jgi:hypothetical protein
VLFAAAALAQQDAELFVNNSFRVVSTSKNTVTQRAYPYGGVEAPGYNAQPGVAAGTRAWTYTPPLRVQTGSQGSVNEYVVTGFSQAIYVGAANNNQPVTNHYQFATGIGPSRATTTPPLKLHDPAAPDVIHVGSGAVVIPPQTTIHEHNFKLTTPIPVRLGTDLLLFLEFRGGEWRDDPNGGQMHGNGYYDGLGPANLNYQGHTTGAPPNRTIVQNADLRFRTKIGLLIQEPVLTVTGDHANFYYTPRLVNERFRGLGATAADYSTTAISTIFFDVSAGSAFGNGGVAVPFLNVSPVFFPGSLPLPGLGNLLLNLGDPNLGFFAGLVMGLDGTGSFSGAPNPIPVGNLGPSTKGLYIKSQAVVFDGAAKYLLTTASGMQIR